MTNLDDFDRSLAEFLSDGPTMAPEAPVIAALAHARTAPRRPDPLRAFRSDPMARPRRIVGLRPGFVLAVVALVGASVGVAVIGSRPPGPSIVVAPTPSAPPGTPLATMPARFERSIPLTVAVGGPVTLTVIDETGVLVAAESGTPVGDGASVDGVDIAADPADDRALIVTWVGSCETRGTMTVDGRQRTIAIVMERCDDDTFPSDRVVRLEFGTSVRPDEWSGTATEMPASSQPVASAVTGGPEPIGSPAVPPVHVDLIEEAGNDATIDVVDESGQLVSAVAAAGATEQGSSDFDATNVAETSIRLDWIGSPCDTIHRLTIDPTLTTLTIDRPLCQGDAMPLSRALVLTFRTPVDATDLHTSIFSGRGGIDMPTFTATGLDAAGGRFDIQVSDPGYLVESVDAGYVEDRVLEPNDPRPGEAVLEEVQPNTARLVWNAPSCAGSFSLSMNIAGNVWSLGSERCEASGTVLRMVELVHRAPVTVGAITLEAAPLPG
jgi:hypothetical protein